MWVVRESKPTLICLILFKSCFSQFSGVLKFFAISRVAKFEGSYSWHLKNFMVLIACLGKISRCRTSHIKSGRGINDILLTVVRDSWKDHTAQNMGSKLGSFLRKRRFLLRFAHRTANIVRDNAKKFASVGLSYKDVILFLKLFFTCSI